MHSQDLYCAACDAVVPFEQTPFTDDRDDHPEWACGRCGEAIMLAPLTVLPVSLRPLRTRPVAPQQRRAAA